MDDHGNKQSQRRFAGQLTAHRARVFAWVMHRVGSNRALAEDVTQDCFVRVWETRQSNPPPPGALPTYLLTTARNLLRDRYRRRNTFTVEDFDPTHTAQAETPEERFLLRETVERLAVEAALMPFLLRETLRLRVEEGLDYPTIAARMDCPVGTVKSRLNAARHRLRTALEAQEEIKPADMDRSVRVKTYYTVSPLRSETTTFYKEKQTMASSEEINELRSQIKAMEGRLIALENGTPTVAKENSDYWEAPRRRFAQELTRERKEKGSGFALGFYYVLAQSSDKGNEGSASVTHTFKSADSLPSDRQLEERLERMRLLTSEIAIPRVFRHFYALRFAGKDMRATVGELAASTGASEETITRLLKPLVADRTMLLVRDGGTGETYEWEGNDVAITTLLLTAP